MILIINAKSIELETSIIDVVKKYTKHYTIKARNVIQSSLDMTIEINTKEISELIKNITAIDGVYSVSALAHDGEVTF